jgi:low affinity Fe/Cu permease
LVAERARSGQRSRDRNRKGDLLHGLGRMAAGERVAVTVACFVAAWLIVYAAVGFPPWMATALEVVAAGVTLVMLFVIQHHQRRQEIAVHLKLDELVHATDADDDMAAIEDQSADELERRRERAVR